MGKSVIYSLNLPISLNYKTRRKVQEQRKISPIAFFQAFEIAEVIIIPLVVFIFKYLTANLNVYLLYQFSR